MLCCFCVQHPDYGYDSFGVPRFDVSVATVETITFDDFIQVRHSILISAIEIQMSKSDRCKSFLNIWYSRMCTNSIFFKSITFGHMDALVRQTISFNVFDGDSPAGRSLQS